MTSSISWIDRDGLSQTLTRMGLGGRQTPSHVSRQRPSEPAIIHTSPPPPTEPLPLPPFEAPPGSLRERLVAFIDWLGTAGEAAFIVDQDGLPLVDRRADADLLAIASSIMQLIARLSSSLLSRMGHAAIVQLDEGRLILLSVTTPIGPYIVGYVGHDCPNRETQELIAESLRRAFRRSEDDRFVG